MSFLFIIRTYIFTGFQTIQKNFYSDQFNKCYEFKQKEIY